MTPLGIDRPEPRWPAVLAAFSAVALHFALPPALRFGPPWVVAGLVAVLVTSAFITRRRGMHGLNNVVGFAILAVLAAGLVFGVASLILGLVHGKTEAADLLQSAAVLWFTNVIVFAICYWRLDAGGPNARERRDAHTEGAFLFPQMTFPAPNASDAHHRRRGGLAPALRRLSVRRVQHEHRVLADRRARALQVGEDGHDAAGDHLVHHGRPDRRARREHPSLLKL